ncbi:MAG: hypothetical protein IT159_15530 [Bryobacterales bacterium]|nr:hypothetical protein [Bryobacterales bacterium]
MLYFPQLESGAMTQYPFVKQRIFRTVSNSLADGRTVKLGDPGATRILWEFTFEGLVEQERETLEEFFQTVEGRLRDFVLLDPADNLLAWSGDLEAASWSRGPLISLTGGLGDPEGGSGAFAAVNAGAAPQSIQQTVNAPGRYWYCFSVYARSSTSAAVSLFRSSGGVTEERVCALSAEWTRFVLSGRAESTAESVVFGVTLPAGAALELYGMQAEAQPAPSVYRKTTSRTGLYANARFEEDALSVRTDGPETHACRVRIGAPLPG